MIEAVPTRSNDDIENKHENTVVQAAEQLAKYLTYDIIDRILANDDRVLEELDTVIAFAGTLHQLQTHE